tara:strand:- start:1331 stop:1714 length:384 start_codon:yes stop_codon:yes gene_type:complete
MKINTKNTVKIDKALAIPQKKCSARLLNAADIKRNIIYIEQFLTARLFKKDWKGLKFRIFAETGIMPGSYRGTPYTTIVCVERGSDSWFMTYAGRCTMPAHSRMIIPINLEIRTEEIISYMMNKVEI